MKIIKNVLIFLAGAAAVVVLSAMADMKMGKRITADDVLNDRISYKDMSTEELQALQKELIKMNEPEGYGAAAIIRDIISAKQEMVEK